MVCRILLVAAIVVAGAVPALAAEPPALAKARALYNAGNFEGAIDAAAVARRQPQWADAAALVMARSYLERYRERSQVSDLTDAREALGAVRAAALNPRDQVDLLVGLGQWLYLGENFGAAAELFDNALTRDSLLSDKDRLLLLDWWASALDREAQTRAPERRQRIFERIISRMEDELRQSPGNPAANYWLAVASRGAGDADRAWDAAIAAWVRSSLSPATTENLRTDLDRLVTQALIPERARMRPQPEQQTASATLRAEWDLVKQQWK
jgi:tetratricopeptide (TPR) repeat protein